MRMTTTVVNLWQRSQRSINVEAFLSETDVDSLQFNDVVDEAAWSISAVFTGVQKSWWQKSLHKSTILSYHVWFMCVMTVCVCDQKKTWRSWIIQHHPTMCSVNTTVRVQSWNNPLKRSLNEYLQQYHNSSSMTLINVNSHSHYGGLKTWLQVLMSRVLKAAESDTQPTGYNLISTRIKRKMCI